MQKKRLRKYSIDQSPLYKLNSRRRLAELLGVSPQELEELANNPDNERYRVFELPAVTDPFSKQRKERAVQCPNNGLIPVHDTLFKFLSRVQTPEYLHSAVAGRSYISNARQHISGTRAIKLDIRRFFPSVKQRTIHRCFLEQFKCSQDVSAILAKLCTYNGVLPTGSPISPVLSFHAHRALFDEISALAESENLVFTCYIDDVVLSGNNASARLIPRVRALIHKHGLEAHPSKSVAYRKGSAKLITGVVIRNGVIMVPHERLQRIRRLRAAVNGKRRDDQDKLLEKYVGMLGEVSQIDFRFRGWMLKETGRLKSMRVRRQLLKRQTAAKKRPKTQA